MPEFSCFWTRRAPIAWNNLYHAKFRDGLCFRELEWDTQAIYSKNDEEEATATDTVDSKAKSAVYIG